jgi:rhodanese-related sulfurtransferase
LSTRDGGSWPVAGEVLRFGAHVLRRVALNPAQLAYLLGEDEAHHAFTGDAAAQDLARWVSPETLLCPGREAQNACCTSLRAEAQATRGGFADMQLDSASLEALLQSHPQALLVDVREACEQAACLPGGRSALSVPLSRLADELPVWLSAQPQVPLVFFCRSGNRSAKAAHCLRRLGYAQAYTLNGGLALASPALALAE